MIAQSYLWAARAWRGTARPSRRCAPRFDVDPRETAVAHLSFVPPDYESTVPAPLVLVRRAVHVAAGLGRALATDRRSALHRFRDGGILGDDGLSLRPRRSISSSATAASSSAATSKGRKQFWSRGNGWVFAGIANILDVLPKDDPTRPRMEALFREMAAKLKTAAEARRLLAAVAACAPENSPPETSGTGFYVYGLAWGVKRGLLDARTYRAAIDAAGAR